jgi:hypothetical protein
MALFILSAMLVVVAWAEENQLANIINPMLLMDMSMANTNTIIIMFLMEMVFPQSFTRLIIPSVVSKLAAIIGGGMIFEQVKCGGF